MRHNSKYTTQQEAREGILGTGTGSLRCSVPSFHNLQNPMMMPRIARIVTFSTFFTRSVLHSQAFTSLSSTSSHKFIDSSSSTPTFLKRLQTSCTTRSMSATDSSSSKSEPPKKKRVLVPIADDSEEIETSCITDTLVRFGAEVVVASVKPDGDLVCRMSRGLKICADVTIADATSSSQENNWDLIALPGGMPGAKHLRDCDALVQLLKKQNEAKKLCAAVCASPAVVFQSMGLLGSGATSYPAPPFRSTMDDPSDDKVVVQGNIVTSQGPGTSLLFAIALGEQLVSKNRIEIVDKGKKMLDR